MFVLEHLIISTFIVIYVDIYVYYCPDNTRKSGTLNNFLSVRFGTLNNFCFIGTYNVTIRKMYHDNSKKEEQLIEILEGGGEGVSTFWRGVFEKEFVYFFYANC